MESSLFDALKMKTLLADMWTTREQLCLASAVAKSGDKNWGVVSKSIQSLTTEKNRPPDWYSTKNCVFQYSKLLDQVELLKKRRDKELPPNETPQQFLLKLLTKKRVEELKQLLERERNRYNQLRKEILQLESNQLDNKLNLFWEDILKEQELEEQEEAKRQKNGREREEKLKNLAKYQAMKASMQSSSKVKGSMSSSSSHKGQHQTTTEESQTVSDVPQIKKPKSSEGKDSDQTDPVSVDSENEISSTENHPSELLPVSDREISPKEDIEEESGTEKYFPVEVKHEEEEEEEEETKLPEVLDNFEVNKCDSSFETNLPLDYTSNLNVEMKEEEDEEEEMDDEEEEEDEDQDQDQDQDQEQSQELVKKPVEDAEKSFLPPDVSEDKMEESDTRDDLPSTIAEEKKETKEISDSEKAFEKEDLTKPDNIVKTEKKEEEESLETFVEEETEAEEDIKRKREEKKSRKKKIQTDIKNEEDKVSEPPSEETEEVFSQTIKRDEIIDTVMQTPVVEPEIKKIFTSESSSSIIASEGLISIKDVEKKIPTTPTLKKEVKDEYEFDDDASRESTDVKDYMMSRSDRRKFSLSENVSSPVVSESTPSSPASTNYGDDPEAEKAHRVWKRSIMLLWNDIAAHKNASIFLKPITEDKVPGYHSIVYRPMDLMTIKRNIENGSIRTTSEFQRDLLLMFLNAKMYNTRNHNIFRMAQDMLNDAVETLEEFIQAQMLAKVVETPQKSLRRETRESSAKRGVDDLKRKRDDREEKTPKRRKV